MHPEWCVQKADGSIDTANYDLKARPEDPKPVVSWKFLFPDRGYRELMLAQVEEICRMYDVDGFFFDICGTLPDYSEPSLRAIRDAGRDPKNPADVKQHAVERWVSFMSTANRIIRGRHPDATVFYNGLAHPTTPQPIHDCQTHFELEDLPTTWGGYDKFAPRAKYFANKGKPMLAMSGKFHTMWGEFGGFKHPDAIRFEAACMIAYGAACSFGDQVHPSGEMDLQTYRNIGHGYSYVQQIEAYGLEAQPCSNLGLYIAAAGPVHGEHGAGAHAHDQGVANMLMEGQLDFQAVEPDGDLARFDTIILTGGRFLTRERGRSLMDYVKNGGSLVVLGESALDVASDKVVLDIGGTYQGPARFKEDYLVVGKELGKGLVSTPFLNYTAAIRIKPTSGKVLGRIHEPYFDRTYARYCSHQNTPNQLKPAAHAGALRKGQVVYLAHALGKMYYEHGARLHRDLFLNALRSVYTKPVVQTSLPSAGRVNLLHQPQHRRYVVHLMYGPPLQRGRCLVIEDLPRLARVPVSLRVPEQIKRATLPLSGKTLASKRSKGLVQVEVPELVGHQLVTFEY
jgi:hypothetical protein